jgi:murein tripeptide amidase MpaA
MLLLSASASLAQPDLPSKVPLAFDRYYDTTQLHQHLREIAAAYPDLVTLKTIGKSIEGREMVLAIVTNPKTGPDTAKPAMWIDGNIHGNEVQAGEVVLYTLWYLTKAYGKNEKLTKLLDTTTFYLLPTANPDGRQFWFDHANTPHSSRQNKRPIDNDLDGRVNEDAPDDLDGDGQITQMWREEVGATGRWVRSQTDDRVFVHLRDDQAPAAGVKTYTYLGEEGIDNDLDGRINEDGPFGDDMNRNWPSDWQPEHIQGGAGPYPLSSPETRAIADFILAHPNIAAGQSYHNAGGMILRGPGAQSRDGLYPGEDVRVYDELQRTGEQILPYYRGMVLYRDLYGVRGGELNWLAEGLGAFTFTNELWTEGKYFQRDNTSPNEEQRWLWRDRLAFGQLFSPYKEFEHPQFGKVLIGGLNKWSTRVTPTFMLEEECHRNFAFTMYHAEQMAALEWGRTEIKKLGSSGGVNTYQLTVEIRNTHLFPTRSGIQSRNRIGRSDLCTLTPPAGATIAAAARVGSWYDLFAQPIDREPSRIQLPEGIPGRGTRTLRWFIEAPEGASVTLEYSSERAVKIQRTIELKP